MYIKKEPKICIDCNKPTNRHAAAIRCEECARTATIESNKKSHQRNKVNKK